MMRLIGFAALLIVLFTSLFKIGGADLTNNVTGVALMVLLLSLFTDLKEFNFWGLKGVTKEEKKLKELKGEQAVKPVPAPKIPPSKVQQAVRQETVVVTDSENNNFLAMEFEIERLIKIIAAVLTAHEIPSSMKDTETVQILRSNDVLTASGVEQINSLRWLRNMLVHGRQNELSRETLQDGTDMAYNLYMDLRNWVEDAQTPVLPHSGK